MDNGDKNDPLRHEFAELEAELRRLRPALSPERLLRAIEGDLAQTTRASKRARAAGVRVWWVTLPLAVAAAWAVWMNVSSPVGKPLPTSEVASAAAAATKAAGAQDVFQPVAAKSVPLAESDEDFVTLVDGTVARRTRETYLATITWRNPRTNASLTWSVPREDVQVVPVSYQ